MKTELCRCSLEWNGRVWFGFMVFCTIALGMDRMWKIFKTFFRPTCMLNGARRLCRGSERSSLKWVKRFHQIMVAVSSNNIFIFCFVCSFFHGLCGNRNVAKVIGFRWQFKLQLCQVWLPRGLPALEVIYFHSFNFLFHSILSTFKMVQKPLNKEINNLLFV